MPDTEGKPLPPIPDEAFDGNKEKTELKFPKCSHKNARLIDAHTVRCSCGACWTGPDAKVLSHLLQTS